MRTTAKRLSEMQIIQMLISPRAALDRMLATGTIDYDDHGALQCVYVLAVETDNVSGIPCPNINPMVSLCQSIAAGAVNEEQIEAGHKWLDEYRKYLKRVPLKQFARAVDTVKEKVRSE